MDSIIQKDRKCFICGSRGLLNLHHCIYGTGKRALSDKYGLTIYLCPIHHTYGINAVHNNKVMDDEIKRMAQEKAMEYYGWSEEDFIKIFRRNYL